MFHITDFALLYYFSLLQSVHDLVTINIGLKDITWLHMTKERDVLQWAVHTIDNIDSRKWEPQKYFNVVSVGVGVCGLVREEVLLGAV